MKELRYLNKYYSKYFLRLLLGVLFVFGSNYFQIRVTQKIRDSLNFIQNTLQEKETAGMLTMSMQEINKLLLFFALTVVSFMIIRGIFMFMMRQTIIVTSRLIEYDMRKEIYDHLQTMDTDFYKSSRTGDLMARISEDVSKVRDYLGPGILYGLNLVSLFSFTIYAMLSVNVKLAFYTLLPLPVLSLSIYYVSSLINKKSSQRQKQISKLTTIAQEVFSGIRVVKSYGKESAFLKYFTAESEVFRAKSMEVSTVNAYFFPLMVLLINLSTLIVLYVGGQEVANGTITAANIAEFIIYVNMLTWPVTAIGWIASIVQEAEASQQRINELLNTKSKQSGEGIKVEKIEGKIEFKNVSFTYKDTGIKALNNISFKANKGDNIAIVGKTASGKSTIAELLLGMHDIDAGQLTIDDQPINTLNKFDLRTRIGYVPQDVFLFSDTVANNISFGVGNRSMEEIIEYAEYAAVKDDILKLPNQFETIIGERGVTLSGGQKQRVSIARALIKDPHLIILDDCLSAVDTETEQKIMSYLNRALYGKTSIIITHRVTSLIDFDKIIILDHGQIVEQGSHQELMQLNGYYSELYQKSQMDTSENVQNL